jgi:hypothetical protein
MGAESMDYGLMSGGSDADRLTGLWTVHVLYLGVVHKSYECV